MSFDPDEVKAMRAEITAAEEKLYALYEKRRQLFLREDKRHGGTMTRREIGEVWGISSVAVTFVINKNTYKVTKESK